MKVLKSCFIVSTVKLLSSRYCICAVNVLWSDGGVNVFMIYFVDRTI